MSVIGQKSLICKPEGLGHYFWATLSMHVPAKMKIA
jgi:hypothetical protein